MLLDGFRLAHTDLDSGDTGQALFAAPPLPLARVAPPPSLPLTLLLTAPSPPQLDSVLGVVAMTGHPDALDVVELAAGVDPTLGLPCSVTAADLMGS